MNLSLRDIAMTIWKSKAMILLISFICAAAFALCTLLFVKPTYTVTSKLYVYNDKVTEKYISSSDLDVSKSLVDTYLIIIRSNPVLERVCTDLSKDHPGLTTKDILEMLSGSAINDTEAFFISAESTDRQLAMDIIEDIVKVAPKEIIRIVKAASVEIIEEPKLPEKDDYEWNLIPNILIGFSLGLLLSIAYVVISNSMDTTIYGRNEILQSFKLPIIGVIPEVESDLHVGKRKRGKELTRNHKPYIIAKNAPFTVEEAYRKTRSNIIYLPEKENKNCKTFVVTSALAAEGKSSFSINLSISLAQSGNKVLLIDSDMLKPKISEYLEIPEQNGLSEYLAKITDTITPINHMKNMDIIVSGKRTPYAAELLSTNRAKEFLENYKNEYDYIIIDSPPVNEVSDAMTYVESADGYILCAIAGYSDVEESKQSVLALEQIGAKIFGFVVLGVDYQVEQYGRYKRYGKYAKYGKYANYGHYGKYGKYGSYRYYDKESTYGQYGSNSDSDEKEAEKQ